MSSRLETLQVARLAPSQLRDAAGLVLEFLESQLSAEGGFLDRAGAPDLYYTLFGLESWIALREEPPAERVLPWLRPFRHRLGELDLVHLGSLLRCDAALGHRALGPDDRAAAAARLDAFRTPDGGYHTEAGRERGTVYGAFVALGALEDLEAQPGTPEAVLDFLATLETPDGGWSNEPGMPLGTTPATAAAVDLRRRLGAPPRAEAGDWLLARWNPAGGGFFAAPGVPIPDLLSTAVALHALASLERPLGPLEDPCLDFVDSLWTAQGSFHAHWREEVLDCEYTWYGLLALGHLSL